jgi:hypothetical protein
MTTKTLTFRYPRWAIVIVAIGLIVSVTGLISIGSKQGANFLTTTLGLLVVVFFAGLMDVILSRVRISPDILECISNFRSAKFSRKDISDVSWSSGCPVSLQLQTGKWFHLPAVGNSQSMANSIRSWLKQS